MALTLLPNCALRGLVELSDNSGDRQSHIPPPSLHDWRSPDSRAPLTSRRPRLHEGQLRMHKCMSSRCALDLPRPRRALADDYMPPTPPPRSSKHRLYLAPNIRGSRCFYRHSILCGCLTIYQRFRQVVQGYRSGRCECICQRPCSSAISRIGLIPVRAR